MKYVFVAALLAGLAGWIFAAVMIEREMMTGHAAVQFSAERSR